jgi:selenocysteine-specific elongation factor
MIVATAGHIDHGKTTLVRALTGVDTDRLPEEKARGISIDLGFAYIQGDAGLIGFVDVPGHERFVRNMLAGVAGIDLALLLVAADDGVMPQTREHLQILDLLEVRRGIAVISKTDRVASARVAEVASDVEALLAATSLAGAPLHRVSATTGEGVEDLRGALAAAARAHGSRFRDGHHFRLAVDRAFSVAGSGTVVTGTVMHGSVKRGDRLMVSPAGHEVRVRGIEIRGLAAEGAQAGERCALNLAGAEAAQVKRGDWVLEPRLHAPTQRVDVLLKLLPTEREPLEHWTQLHLHLGTDALSARVATPRAQPIQPGASAHAQLVLERPALAVNGDRYIVRDQSGRRTLGGGIVLDPFAPRRRPAANRAAVLAALERNDPLATLQTLLGLGAVEVQHFERAFNLTPERLAALARACGATMLGREQPVMVPAASVAPLNQATVAKVEAFHRANPAAAGIELKQLQREVASHLPLEAFTALVRALAEAGRLAFQGGMVSQRRHDATANPADEQLWSKVLPALSAAGFAPPPAAELAQTLGLDPRPLLDFLHRKAKTGELYRVADDRFYPRRSVAQLAAIAQRLAQSHPNGQFTAAEYRDATHLGRTLAIKVLEFFDGAGVTQRVGDARRFRKDYVAVFGAADEPARAEG